jgi:hypothetical protein
MQSLHSYLNGNPRVTSLAALIYECGVTFYPAGNDAFQVACGDETFVVPVSQFYAAITLAGARIPAKEVVIRRALDEGSVP